MLSPQQLARIKQVLRTLWMKSPDRYAVLKDAKRRVPVGYYKNKNTKWKVFFECASCNQLVEKVAVDHRIPVEPSKNLQQYSEKLFCSRENLQPLCTECHQLKTAKERSK